MTEFASWRRAAALLGLLAAAACAHEPSASPATAAASAATSAPPPEAASPDSGGAVPAPAASPPPAAPASPATELLAKGRAPFDACYAEARAARPSLGHTTVEITFALADDGSPMTIDLQYKDRVDDHAKECMRAAAFKVRFPAALRGKQTGSISF